MKNLLKTVLGRILASVLILVIIAVGVIVGYKCIKKKYTLNVEHIATNSIEIVKEKLEKAAELNTGSYFCTSVLTKTDSKEVKGWKIPLTEKSFIISYDGVVKSGIKDLTKCEVKLKDETIIIKVPAVEITSIEIDNESFQKLDENNNIFNRIKIEDLNNAQIELKEKMKQHAIDKGVLELAKSNAENILRSLLNFDDEYEIKIEWQ